MLLFHKLNNRRSIYHGGLTFLAIGERKLVDGLLR